MRRFVRGWYLNALSPFDIPASVDELVDRATKYDVTHAELRGSAMWEPLFRGETRTLERGWTTLANLVETRRGIATGSNSFFHLSSSQVEELQLPSHALVPCVGRANDVQNLIFTGDDFDQLDAQNARVWLLSMRQPLMGTELAYIQKGEEAGLLKRFILKSRSPWYTMERRPKTPIWAAVFGRGDLKFVLNETESVSLTNFHGVYPKGIVSHEYCRALVAVLNSQEVRERAATTTRTYGGGLKKFEPNDLKRIRVPDLRHSNEIVLNALGDELQSMDESARLGHVHSQDRLSALVQTAVEQAKSATQQTMI